MLAALREEFGPEVLPLNLPAQDGKAVIDCFWQSAGDSDLGAVADWHQKIIDQVVEINETVMEHYLDLGEGGLSGEELHDAFEQCLREGHLVPVCFASARTGVGVKELLDVAERLFPNPAEANPPPFVKSNGSGQQRIEAVPDPRAHVIADVFKIVNDPFVGKLGIFRVYQGTLKKDTQLFVDDGKKPFKVGHLFKLKGKDHVEIEHAIPGDIAAVAKVEEIHFDAVLHDSHDEDHIHLVPLEFPKPMAGLAVETKKKGDEQRLFDILGKLAMEDPTFVVERHPTSNETVIRGLGEIHLKAKLAKMVSQYKLEVDTKPPRIPYRETITGHAEAMYRHKKQSGGAGQFGEVHLRIEPKGRGEGFEFVDAVKGGVIPGVFMAAVEKGIRQGLEGGVVAGYEVEDVKVTVYDGKTHAVDGKEVAFTIAGRKAVIEAVRNARPIVLEPIVNIEIVVPESAIGDLTGDLSSRRGHITGTDGRGHGLAAITGEVPLAELNDYQSRLKSLTGGQGSYTIEFARYSAVPPNVQQQMASKFQLHDEDE